MKSIFLVADTLFVIISFPLPFTVLKSREWSLYLGDSIPNLLRPTRRKDEEELKNRLIGRSLFICRPGKGDVVSQWYFRFSCNLKSIE